MAAEPDPTHEAQQNRHLSLVALYEREEDANDLLARLAALAIDTDDATIVRVDNSLPLPGQEKAAATLSPRTRGALTGAIIGSALSFIAGFIFYEAGLFRFPFGSGLFPTELAAIMLGAGLGALIGSLTTMTKEVVRPAKPEVLVSKPARDGFLVVVKIPVHLAEQAETIARRLGAKEIIL